MTDKVTKIEDAPKPKRKRVVSMEEIDNAKDTEYRVIEGFTKDEEIVIGSLTAGDMLEWGEANEGEAKKTAGLRLLTKSFTSKDPDDPSSPDIRYAADPVNIDKFRKRNHQQALRILKEILELNGMGDTPEATKTVVAEAKKD